MSLPLSPSSDECDVAIIGGGHNGLVCAAYLAAAELNTLVLEKNSVAGGAALTEEFHPGYRNSVASYTDSLLNPKVIRELDLARHGLRIVERPAANFVPVDEKCSLLMPYGMEERQKALAASRSSMPSDILSTMRRSSGRPVFFEILCCERLPTPEAGFPRR
jgi:phytoene dehydrogenase-like protein